MNETDFLTKQEQIYLDFRSFKSAILPFSVTSNAIKSGYLIALQYDFHIFENLFHKLTLLSEKIPELILNPPQAIHTTITVTKDNLDTLQIEKIIKVCENHNEKIQKIELKFKELLFNDNAIILAGKSNNFFQFADELLRSLKKQIGLDLRYPKMTHITLSRIRFEKSAAGRMNNLRNELVKLANSFQEIKISPNKFIFGRFSQSNNKFEFRNLYKY